MNSKNRNQLDLLAPLPRSQPYVELVTPELIESIRRRPTFLAAWNFAQQFSALEDKAVYQQLGIDASTWTKIGKGQANPPADERFVQYLEVVQNEFPLIWLAEKRGYDWTTIRRHQSDLEKENAQLRQERDDWRRAATLAWESRGGSR